MVRQRAAIGVDDQIVLDARDLEIALQSYRRIDLSCRGRQHLDDDDRVGNFECVGCGFGSGAIRASGSNALSWWMRTVGPSGAA